MHRCPNRSSPGNSSSSQNYDSRAFDRLEAKRLAHFLLRGRKFLLEARIPNPVAHDEFGGFLAPHEIRRVVMLRTTALG